MVRKPGKVQTMTYISSKWGPAGEQGEAVMLPRKHWGGVRGRLPSAHCKVTPLLSPPGNGWLKGKRRHWEGCSGLTPRDSLPNQLHSFQGHTHRSGSKHIPGKEHSPYISVPTGSREQGSPPAYLRLCWAASTKSASASAETWLSPPRGGRYINPASDYACSGKRTLSCLLLSISPPDFLWRLPSSLCHCVALEQGPYLTRVSPPSCDHDFQVLGRTSFSLRSPIDEGSSSSGSQPSNCLIFSLQLPRTTGGTLKCKDTGKKTVTLANITDT